MNITIRQAHPEDYPALIDIYNAQNEPHHQLTEDELRSSTDRSYGKIHYRRLSAVVDGEVVGTGQFGERPGDNSPGKYWAWFFVRDDYRNRGVDTALWDEALSLLSDTNPVSLWTCVREDFVPAAGYLRERSYREQFRSWGANLDLAKFDPDRFQYYRDALPKRGIHLRSFDELATDPRRDEKIAALQAELEEEAPYCEPIIAKRHPTINDSSTLLESLVVGVSDDDYIGMASLFDQPGFPNVAGSGLTGVKEGFRNLGVATALKAKTVNWAKGKGYAEVNAGGAGVNVAILKVNRRIGFDVEPAWVTYARFL